MTDLGSYFPIIVEKEHALDNDEEVCEITSEKSAKATNRGRYIVEVAEEIEFKKKQYSELENGNNINAGCTPYQSHDSPPSKIIPSELIKEIIINHLENQAIGTVS